MFATPLAGKGAGFALFEFPSSQEPNDGVLDVVALSACVLRFWA